MLKNLRNTEWRKNSSIFIVIRNIIFLIFIVYVFYKLNTDKELLDAINRMCAKF